MVITQTSFFLVSNLLSRVTAHFISCFKVPIFAFDQAVAPSNQQYNSDTLKVITELINKDQGGALVALRLLAHKLQSPQEREALNALACLEALANKCDPSFRSELGKFKFLNEIIKVLSPKYLGEQSTPSVKQKCAQLLYEWHREYGHSEPKFTEAYNMLCKQGLINPEIIHQNGIGSTPSGVAVERQPNIFDRSQESQKLAKLLRSRNPADVAEANRLIKKIVEEDQVRTEKVIKRSTEMEALKNNTLLLQEMISNFEKGGASEAEHDLMNELAQNIRTARPVLYTFSLTHDENDIDTLTEIARICDHASSALDLYELRVKNHVPCARSTALLDEPLKDDRTAHPSGDLLSHDLMILGLDSEESSSSNVPSTNGPELLTLSDIPKKTVTSKYDELEDIFASITSTGPTSVPTLSPTSNVVVANPFLSPKSTSISAPHPISSSSSRLHSVQNDSPKTQMFDDLDVLGRQMLGLRTLIPSQTDTSTTPIPAPLSVPSTDPTIDPAEWGALDVPLSAIQPHPSITKPRVIYPSESNDGSGVQLALHYTSNEPAPNVRVFVATVTSRSPLSVTDLHIRFGVNKPMSLRQLTASGHSLAAYSPFLPAGAINQVVLVYDPTRAPTIVMKFQLSFMLDNEAVLESGKVDLPVI
ncbi:ADP-ribosylation factor-binding protein GGA [Clonorchis sinensis]|uniref:ADP-ribosylation factor-binding protein GGA n=1 Tax=Clonorchis sinensis TaxID=79923 RepID=H2KRC4_CLOSI|nr:ADP-ribosylation factor-binding protein GGA [Clonorchis sinensis]